MKAVEEYMKSMIYPELKDESDKVILHSVMEQFANKIVIEELEGIVGNEMTMNYLKYRIKQLKQER
jgi:hypothetical protein